MEHDGLARKADVEWIGRPEHQPLHRRARPMKPAEDPFYIPPTGYRHAAPGTVLRSRDVQLAFLGVIPQRMTARQLLYRSTDRNGAAIAAVTTVVLPELGQRDRGYPLVSYQCAIDAITGRCFPSYALRRRAHSTGAFTQVELLLITALVAQGWAVSIPDHEGLHGEWGAPYEPGYRILDGVRAALNTPEFGLPPDTRVGLWGYSGGGLASAWAAEVCADYAPELDVVGAVLGSPVGDLGNTLRRLNGSFWSGLPGMMVASLGHIYPELQKVIDEHADAAGRRMLADLESMTTGGAIWNMRNKDLDTFVDEPLEQLLDLPAVRHVLLDTKLGGTAPRMPVLMMQAVHDPVISIADIDELARSYAEGGTELSYHRDVLSDHTLLYPLSAPTMARWLADRFAGHPLTGLGTRRGLPKILSPATHLGLLRMASISGRVLTGRVVRRRRL